MAPEGPNKSVHYAGMGNYVSAKVTTLQQSISGQFITAVKLDATEILIIGTMISVTTTQA